MAGRGLARYRMTRRPRRPAERATEREVGVVAAVLAAGSEKAAAHRLGLSHSTVKHHLANARGPRWARRRRAQLVCAILARRLPEPEDGERTDPRSEPQPASHRAISSADGTRP